MSQPTEQHAPKISDVATRAEDIVRSMLTQAVTPANIVEVLAAAGLLRTEPTPAYDPAAWMPDALRAAREALDIPHAATVHGGHARQKLLEDRAMYAIVALNALLDVPDIDELGARSTIAFLRRHLADRPPTGYVTTEQARAALAAGATWVEATTLPGGES
jgi:hypothetical protein